MLILKGTVGSCSSAVTDCFIQYFLAEKNALSVETDCSNPSEAGRCYIARRVVIGGIVTGDTMRLSDTLTSITQLRFFLSGVSAAGFSNQADQEGKVTLIFNLSLAPRQGLEPELAKKLIIPIQTTITQKLYQTSN